MCEAPIKMQKKKKQKLQIRKQKHLACSFSKPKAVIPALFYKAPLSLVSLDRGLKQAVAGTATYVQKCLCVLNSNLIRSPGAWILLYEFRLPLLLVMPHSCHACGLIYKRGGHIWFHHHCTFVKATIETRPTLPVACFSFPLSYSSDLRRDEDPICTAKAAAPQYLMKEKSLLRTHSLLGVQTTDYL